MKKNIKENVGPQVNVGKNNVIKIGIETEENG